MKIKKDEIYIKILKKQNYELYKASLETLKTGDCNNIIFKTTALSVAPILYTYVLWVIYEAKINNIKRLYFLARDGFIMKEIATRICKQFDIDIECKYLYCSRIAWRLPQYHLIKEKCLDKIFINSIDVTLNKILDRACLNIIEKEKICQELLIDKNELNRVLLRHEIFEYKEKFAKCNLFLQYVYEHSKKAYSITISYLKQEGLFDDIKYAIVDTGWTGSMQVSLECLLQSRKIEGFYFGLYNLPLGCNESYFHSFFFGKKGNIKNKVYFNNNLFECICSSPDGMTISYHETEGKIIPVFSSNGNLNLDTWDINMQIDTIIKFTNQVLLQNKTLTINIKKSKKLVYKLCKEFMIYPSYEEANCYGNFKFSDDVTEKYIQILARDMTKKEIKKNFLLNRIIYRYNLNKSSNTVIKQSCWLEGSIIKFDNIKGKKLIKNILLSKFLQYIYQSFN